MKHTSPRASGPIGLTTTPVTDPDPGTHRRGWLVVAAMLAALLVLGTVTVDRFHVWAEIDEQAHYAAVQSVAEQHRWPKAADYVSTQVQAISDHTYPRPSPRTPAQAGLAGRNYEAQQPPLYYLAAALPFELVSNYHTKVFALRAFDLLLLAIGALLIVALARELYADDRDAVPVAVVGAALVLLWPGFVVRAITVSNSALEIPMAAAFMLVAWRAWRAPSVRTFALAGLAFGLCLLTKLTLVTLAAPFAIVVLATLREQPAERVRRIVAAAAIPGAMLLAWLVANVATYGTLTQSNAAIKLSRPYLYPDGTPAFGWHQFVNTLDFLSQAVLPQEWQAQLDVTWVRVTTLALLIALVVGVLWVAVRFADRRLWFVLSPVLAGLVLMFAVLIFGRFDSYPPRYLYALLPGLAMVVAVTAWRVLPRRASQAVFAAYMLTLALLWAKGAAAYWFVNVGHSIGLA